MLNLRFRRVSTVAPTAPTAAASVGEATPAKIDPRTDIMRKSGGKRARSTLLARMHGVKAASSARGMGVPI